MLRNILKTNRSRPDPHSSGPRLMLPLTVDTGPDFGLESFGATMFGHPGISALGFAGTKEKKGSTATLSLKGKASAMVTLDDSGGILLSADGAELETPEPVAVLELSGQQRQKGIFINHTPRRFELRSPKKTDLCSHTTGLSGRTHTASYVSSDDGKTTSWTKQWHRIPPTDSATEFLESITHEIGNAEPIEPGADEVGSTTTEYSATEQPPAIQGSITSSRACQVASPQQVYISTTHTSQETNRPRSGRHSQNTGKRRRRQTPFPLSAPKGSRASRHSPLEPWVAYHRREASIASMGAESVGNVSVEDVAIAKASTFRAIQEYFDNQTAVEPAELQKPFVSPSSLNMEEPTVHNELESSSPSSSPLLPPRPITEPTAIFPIDDLAVPSTPNLPNRNPKRLNTPLSIQVCLDRASHDSASAGHEPQSSSHDDMANPKDTLTVPKHRIVPRKQNHTYIPPQPQQPERAGSSKLGRMAPPILGHEALTATADLNDLSFYLKNTGPPEPLSKSKSARPRKIRKAPGLKMFKAKGKKSLAARVGSVEGSPGKQRVEERERERGFTPKGVVREMTTRGGARHLRIVIPLEEEDEENETRPKRVSMVWTEEMMSPLGSHQVERMIADVSGTTGRGAAPGAKEDEEGDGDCPRTPSTPAPSKSPKRSPIAPIRVLVNDHPLVKREEQTRARKLKGLERVKSLKKRVSHTEESSLPATVTESSTTSLPTEPPVEGPCAEPDDDTINRLSLLKKRVISLQRENTELVEALARIVGLEAEDGDLDANAVLRAYRQIKTGSGDSGYGYGARRGRVFTA